ncbi:hypothetical protein D917_01279 [Trichinella nativa]|uniref:Uncharacterized protein n=1 Tax=Trichinella nativa TaxID=6335 RepID=A0A1Y3EW28_9BILA|nr:hypothetical protein D917_01279 [Trichinella nativa]
MTEMVVTVGSFIVHLFRKVCSACLVKSWKTGSENFQIRSVIVHDFKFVVLIFSFFFSILTSNSIISSYHICSDADGACLVTGLRMSFYWVRVGEIFLMKIQPSPFHSQFRPDCSHKVDPHFLRLSAFRLHTTQPYSWLDNYSASEKMSPKAYGCPGIKFCQKPASNWCNQLLNDLHF